MRGRESRYDWLFICTRKKIEGEKISKNRVEELLRMLKLTPKISWHTCITLYSTSGISVTPAGLLVIQICTGLENKSFANFPLNSITPLTECRTLPNVLLSNTEVLGGIMKQNLNLLISSKSVSIRVHTLRIGISSLYRYFSCAKDLNLLTHDSQLPISHHHLINPNLTPSLKI